MAHRPAPKTARTRTAGWVSGLSRQTRCVAGDALRAAGLLPDSSTPIWMNKVMNRDARSTDPAVRFGL